MKKCVFQKNLEIFLEVAIEVRKKFGLVAVHFFDFIKERFYLFTIFFNLFDNVFEAFMVIKDWAKTISDLLFGVSEDINTLRKGLAK